MIQLKNRSTGKIIEVDEVDAHWYNGHEEYENVETAKTIEAEPQPQKKEVLTLRKLGRPRKDEIQTA